MAMCAAPWTARPLGLLARVSVVTALPRENVQSYPRPPIVEPVAQRILVRLGGAVVADSAR